MTSLVLLILVLAAVLAWLIGRPRSGRAGRGGRRDDDVDRETLERAEQEVRDLDALSTPEDAAQDLPDWGPGAPRP